MHTVSKHFSLSFDIYIDRPTGTQGLIQNFLRKGWAKFGSVSLTKGSGAQPPEAIGLLIL